MTPLVCLLLWGWGLAAAAKPPELSASLSSPQVRPGDPFELTLRIKTDQEVDVAQPEWVLPEGLTQLGSQSRTAFESHLRPGPQGMEFEKKRTIEFIYSLQATREGSYQLGPFVVAVESQNLSVKAITVEVTTKAPAPSRGQGHSRGFGGLGGLLDDEFGDEDHLLGQLLRRQRQRPAEPSLPSRTLPINEKEAFFIIVETDKEEAFEGEQVFASWHIYTKGSIHQFDRLKFPSLKGFWKEDVEPAPNLAFQRELVNGTLFHRALLASYALFPIKAGTAIIDEYKIRATVSLPQSGLGNFGFGQPYTYTRTSAPQRIKIKPLPTEGRPRHFSGAVGQFKVSAHVDHQTFTQGQPFNLRIRFEGDGNAKLIDFPKVEWPDVFEVYDVKSESRFFQSGKSFKEFSILMIPKESGVLEIPPLSFSYFDPTTVTYAVVQTQTVGLQVAPGTFVPGDSARMKLAEEDVAKQGPQLPDPVAYQPQKNWRWLKGLKAFLLWLSAYVGMGLCFYGFYFWWRKRLYKRLTLADVLKLRRQQWEKALADSRLQQPQAAAEIINTIYFLLSRMVDAGGLTKDLSALLEQLPPSLRTEFSDGLKRELDLMQTIAFAPREAWIPYADSAEFRRRSEQIFQLLEKMVISYQENLG